MLKKKEVNNVSTEVLFTKRIEGENPTDTKIKLVKHFCESLITSNVRDLSDAFQMQLALS